MQKSGIADPQPLKRLIRAESGTSLWALSLLAQSGKADIQEIELLSGVKLSIRTSDEAYKCKQLNGFYLNLCDGEAL